MVDLLALYPKTGVDKLTDSVPRPAPGLPINALPGWYRVPLCNKLPMLNCPTKQIIFSRDKMGKKLWKPSEYVLYDPNCYTVKIDYDALHDPHLKNFYSRGVNFKRLQQMGRVTEDKDVVCTLKEFNNYRRYLQRLHLDLINNEIKRRELAQRDKFLVNHAETIARKDCEKVAQKINRSKSEIFRIKKENERLRKVRAMDAFNNLKKSIERIERIKQWKRQTLQEKSKMHSLEIQHRLKHARDLERMRIIALKKKFKIRELRLEQFGKERLIEKQDKHSLEALNHWHKRLEFRRMKHLQNKAILNEAELRKERNVEQRKRIMQMKWDHIQFQIAEKSIHRHNEKDILQKLSKRLQRKLRRKNKYTKCGNLKKFSKNSNRYSTFQRSATFPRDTMLQRNTMIPSESTLTARRKSNEPLKKISSILRKSSTGEKGSKSQTDPSIKIRRLSPQDIQDALSTALSLNDVGSTNRESSEKILSSAKYILEKVLKTVTRNLGEDKGAREYMYRRIQDLFNRTKRHVLQKVERVFSVSEVGSSRRSSEFGATKSCPMSKSCMLPLWSNSMVNTISKAVSFGDIEPIGNTSQRIGSNVDMKSVRTRTPTPASSFTSLTAVVRETCTQQDVQIPFKTQEISYKLPYWTANERIFIEHFYIKFKKSLLVGVEHAVFDSIDTRKREFQLNPRREILELDREYLTNIMAESILTYNLNSYNYYGNTRLCINVLAADCLFDLQNSSLKAKFDPAYQVEPRCRCNVGKALKKKWPEKDRGDFQKF